MFKTFQRLALWYGNTQAKCPIFVQSATSGIVASFGDISMQTYEGKRVGTYDFKRTARMGMFRLALFGPGYSLWIRHLDRAIQSSSKTKAVFLKIACDQFLWAPPALGVFYTWTSVTEGNSLSDGFLRVKTTLWPTLLVNWPFWCTVQIATFSLVPVHLRVAWVSFVQIFWSAYLSGMNENARMNENERMNENARPQQEAQEKKALSLVVGSSSSKSN